MAVLLMLLPMVEPATFDAAPEARDESRPLAVSSPGPAKISEVCDWKPPMELPLACPSAGLAGALEPT